VTDNVSVEMGELHEGCMKIEMQTFLKRLYGSDPAAALEGGAGAQVV